MFTKTQSEIMKIFASKITENFSIRQISEMLKKPYPLIHRSIKPLIQNNLLLKDSKSFLSLNYRENFSQIAYIESLRTGNFLKNKTINLFANDILEKIGADFFIFLFFGSSVEIKEPRDIDVLIILQEKEKTDEIEKIAENIASNFSKKFDIHVISVESAYEMLKKRESSNLLNETLNKHILLFGAENYYRMLKNARQ